MNLLQTSPVSYCRSQTSYYVYIYLCTYINLVMVFSKVFVFSSYLSGLQACFTLEIYGMCRGLRRQTFHSYNCHCCLWTMMSLNEDYNNERNANETCASSSLIKTVILTSLSSNHLHASSSGNVRKTERIKVRKELSQLLPDEQRKLIHRDELSLTRRSWENLLLCWYGRCKTIFYITCHIGGLMRTQPETMI